MICAELFASIESKINMQMALAHEDLMKHLIETRDVSSFLYAVSTRMAASRSNFKVIQSELARLLFGPSAVIQPRESLLFILMCLEALTSAGTSAEEEPRMDTTAASVQSIWHRNPGSISHLLVEIVASKTVPLEDLRACAEIAVQLVENRCLVPSNARLAAKVIQLFKLSSEDIRDWQGVVSFVSQLLSDRSTFSPALALMLHLEVKSDVRFQ